MRLVDDFLIFTPCRASAEAVVRRVMRGALARCSKCSTSKPAVQSGCTRATRAMLVPGYRLTAVFSAKQGWSLRLVADDHTRKVFLMSQASRSTKWR
jgi:hypothetical protein